jgi:uncharacterized protein (TIGR03032 family)
VGGQSSAARQSDFLHEGQSMSALTGAKPPQSTPTGSAGPSPPAPVEFCYTQTDSFVELLHRLNASLLVSTYQANKLLVVRASNQGLNTLVRTFDKPMGMAVDGSRLALGTRKEVWFLRNAPDIAPQVEPVGMHDACFLPRLSHITGDLGIHEVAWCGNELWLVSTRFSCLATLSPDYSFVPRWQPRFITTLVTEDRCHLNGLAIENGQPSLVTALGTTDFKDGWRVDKPRGGCIIDVTSGEFVARGLCMPHSPRRVKGRLFVLESGTGSLLDVDLTSGRREVISRLPGFTRGLVVCGSIAFVGLSKIRPTSAMDGVPIAERRDELRCGIAMVDLRSGRVIGQLEFQTAVEEIFDVQLLPGIRFPEVMGFQKESLLHTFIIPREASGKAVHSQ